MQKVEGSSPFSRLCRKPSNRRVFVWFGVQPCGFTKPDGSALEAVERECSALAQPDVPTPRDGSLSGRSFLIVRSRPNRESSGCPERAAGCRSLEGRRSRRAEAPTCSPRRLGRDAIKHPAERANGSRSGTSTAPLPFVGGKAAAPPAGCGCSSNSCTCGPSNETTASTVGHSSARPRAGVSSPWAGQLTIAFVAERSCGAGDGMIQSGQSNPQPTAASYAKVLVRIVLRPMVRLESGACVPVLAAEPLLNDGGLIVRFWATSRPRTRAPFVPVSLGIVSARPPSGSSRRYHLRPRHRQV